MSFRSKPGHIALPLHQHGYNNLPLRWYRRRVWLFSFVLGFLFLCWYMTSRETIWQPEQISPLGSIQPATHIASGERKLVLILPVDNPGVNLCKVVASATALGYPTPVIVNWNEGFDTSEDEGVPSHLRKITGVANFLQWATSTDAPEASRLGGDDLVLMIDAHDVWMQLPPSVLLQRYFAANEQANARLIEEHAMLNSSPPEQTILVSAQKRCYGPRNGYSDLHCSALPDSPLPDDIYGLFTDYRVLPPTWSRPRYMNSGSFMGPATDMLRYFQRVRDRMDEHLADPQHLRLTGDQGIFAEILGEQEVWRQQVIDANLTDSSSTAVAGAEEFEYSIGLDYTQELVYPTCHSELGGYFVRLEDTVAVQRASAEAGVSPPRVHGVPDNLKATEAPLTRLLDASSASASAIRRGWGDVALYVDFWTTAVPVAVHNNALRDGMKSRTQTWWDKTWFFPYLRQMLEARAEADASGAVEPIAEIGARQGSLVVWPYQAGEVGKAAILFGKNYGLATSGLQATDWEGVCASEDDDFELPAISWHEEVFRDGKGSL